MINAEKLLGGLLRQTLTGGRSRSRRRRRRQSGWGSLLGGGLSGAAGMGILGVAIAAFEHFSQKGSTTATAVPPPPAATGMGAPPPPPTVPAGVVSAPPPPPVAPSPENNKTALLLIQAMIAAANADGNIDSQEEREILDRLNEAGMTLEEREFILKQLAAPPNPESLLSQVDSAELARQFYAVSLLAIVVDTNEEEAYLARLRTALRIDDATAKELHEQFGGDEE